MSPERPLDQHADKVMDFVLSGVDSRSKFVLKGSGKILEESRHTFVAIFKNFERRDVLFTFGTGRHNIGALSLNRVISELTIPKEVEDLEIRDEADGALYEGFLGRHGMPVAVIVLGHTDAKEDSAELFTLPGISPQSALSRIKNAVFEATICLN